MFRVKYVSKVLRDVQMIIIKGEKNITFLTLISLKNLINLPMKNDLRQSMVLFLTMVTYETILSNYGR